jgi:hypothetical protein
MIFGPYCQQTDPQISTHPEMQYVPQALQIPPPTRFDRIAIKISNDEFAVSFLDLY